jgi:hypothetical protein
MKKVMYGISPMRSGTIFLKPGRINWNAISHQERDKFIPQQTGLNIKLTGPSMNTVPNVPRLANAYHTVTLSGCSGLATVSLGFLDSQNRTLLLLL